MNIQRSVTNGRNFECFSEDPVLTGALAAAYVEALQAAGVGATPKHFAGNESEFQRTTMSSEIDERSLREVYLAPFETVVRQARPWALMSSYNKLNGAYTSEHRWLLTDVLRDGWGFDGAVMSDWFGSRSTAATVNAGLDIEMPGPPRDRGAKLVAAVEAGEVARETVRERARNVLRLMQRVGALAAPLVPDERAEDRPAHRALIRRAGAAGAVLLKNEGILPLELADSALVAVIGPNAKVAQIMGGGSSQLNPHYRVSPWEGLVAALGEARLSFAEGCGNARFEPLLTGSLVAEFFDSPHLSGPVVHREAMGEAQAFWVGDEVGGGRVDPRRFSARISGRFVPAASGTHRVGVFAAGFARVLVDGRLVADAWSGWKRGRTFFEEGCDEVVGSVDLVMGQLHEIVVEFASKQSEALTFSAFRAGIGLPLGDEAIAEAVRVAREADVALVFVGRNGEWDTEGSDLEGITLPGRQDELVAAVAAANPRTVVVLQTGGPVEMPWLDRVPAVLEAWYPGQECGNAIADVLTGAVEPCGRLPQSFPARWEDNPTASRDPEVYPGRDGKVRYAEGVFVGYRHYDRSGVPPLFPFGHGLGYTRMELVDFSATGSGPVTLRAQVRNAGPRPGATVLQVYVAAPTGGEPRPTKELKAFARLEIGAGETQEAVLELVPRDFAWWDASRGQWRIEGGEHTVLAGFSSADLPARATLDLESAAVDDGAP
jgi:beta-glucosidase